MLNQLLLEASVHWGQFPTPDIARKTHMFRTTGLGIANLASLLMSKGVPYDSTVGRNIAANTMSLVTGYSYLISSLMAQKIGAFEMFEINREPMLNVIEMHRDAAKDTNSLEVWNTAFELGKKFGYRNAQVSVIAPTGCLIKDSLIPTDYGLLTLGEIKGRNEDKVQKISLTVNSDEGPQKADLFAINGEAPTRVITTKNGYSIQGTHRHKIKVLDKNMYWHWKRFDEIVPGDVVPMQMNYFVGKTRKVSLSLKMSREELFKDSKTVLPEYMTRELAILLGYIKSSAIVDTNNKEIILTIKEHFANDTYSTLQNLIVQTFKIKGIKSLHEGKLALKITDRVVFDFLENLSLDDFNIPLAIRFTNSRKVISGYLRGLYEGGAVIWNHRGYICFKNKNFAANIQTILLGFGILTTLKAEKNGQYKLLFRNSEYLRQFGIKIGMLTKRHQKFFPTGKWMAQRRDDYIYINRKDMVQLVKSTTDMRLKKLKRKLSHPDLAVPNRFTRDNIQEWCRLTHDVQTEKILDYTFEVIVSNEDGGVQPTYDLSVPSNYTYNAQGFVSHNTIAFAMDCAATSTEPFFSHMVYKKLVGGGSMVIVNPVIEEGLTSLGYDKGDKITILEYIKSHNGKFEGAPRLKKEHYGVFDTANKNGDGQRYISPLGHIYMMSALQPFVTGAISKTVNLPKEATVEDIKDVYLSAWKNGIKGVTVYRDGSKATQPLNTKLEDNAKNENLENLPYAMLLEWAEKAKEDMNKPKPTTCERNRATGVRYGSTHPARIDGVKIYTTINRNEQGEIIEIYITSDKVGSLITGLLNSLSKSISVMLQHHVNPADISKMLRGQQYEPSGFVQDHPYIKNVQSISDLISKIIDIELGDYSRCQIKPAAMASIVPRVSPLENQTSPESAPTPPKKAEGEKVYGKTCSTCGSTRLRQNGTCMVCEECGSTTGCS